METLVQGAKEDGLEHDGEILRVTHQEQHLGVGEAGEGPKLPDQSEESINYNYIDQSEQSIYLARTELLELASLRLTRTVPHLCPVILVSGLVWKLGRGLSYSSSVRGMSIMLPDMSDMSLTNQHLL